MVAHSLRIAVCGLGREPHEAAESIKGAVSSTLADHPDVQVPHVAVTDQNATQSLSARHHLVVSTELTDSPWVDISPISVTNDTETDALGTDRLGPWALNWHNGRRAPRAMIPVQADPNPAWPEAATRLIGRLWAQLTETAVVRIDHIGSTSVRGLTAKDLIDIQITVPTNADAPEVADAAALAGFVRVRGEWFGLDQHGNEYREEVVVDADPERPVNINIRAADEPVARETLLYRDWLRSNPVERDRYAALKARLVSRSDQHVDDYGEQKRPFISAAIARAEDWAKATGWRP